MKGGLLGHVSFDSIFGLSHPTNKCVNGCGRDHRISLRCALVAAEHSALPQNIKNVDGESKKKKKLKKWKLVRNNNGRTKNLFLSLLLFSHHF